ncbi:DNA-3-methyladenine glycosylase I [Macrococcus lamae]|uniref:DNA-3-methyladenine glycosylase I n=1 Tax=Macrococcus lamae TaxID=198484 RepID=A0A4R6BTH9_9STAP|nr:DNA-3-methyladenine glycosylase I [Macrococcus lamae]TDM07887.1 DNA-3-methyladenine glycosylase I [Macrococcus lamae]
MKRFTWADSHPLMKEYYDTEWGKPVHDDRLLFELLILEGFQAGLSWLTVLKKRKTMETAFNGFDVAEIVKYDDNTINTILEMPDMIKHRAKIESVVTNASAFQDVQREFGSFSGYLWSYVSDEPLVRYYELEADVPTKDELSERVSKDLKKRGFKFVGPVVTYSYLGAVGIIQDRLR